MEQLFGNIDMTKALAQRECFNRADATMERIEANLEGKSAAEQRAYLERNHRDALERFGDLLRPLNVFSNETDEQAVARLLYDMRSEENRRCARIR